MEGEVTDWDVTPEWGADSGVVCVSVAQSWDPSKVYGGKSVEGVGTLFYSSVISSVRTS